MSEFEPKGSLLSSKCVETQLKPLPVSVRKTELNRASSLTMKKTEFYRLEQSS
jgi:hypothetical protein